MNLKALIRPRLAVIILFIIAGAARPALAATCTPVVTSGQTLTLYAGKSIDAGTVTLAVNGGNLDVTFATRDGWTIDETHVWVGTDLAAVPQTKSGNTTPGRFPYTSGPLGLESYTVTIPLAAPEIAFSCGDGPKTADYALMAHAALRRPNGDGTFQTETGWSEGDRLTAKGNWSTYSTFTLGCSCVTTPSVGGSCETAFGWLEGLAIPFTTYTDAGTLSAARWGWTNGPLPEGTYTLRLFAGAGQNDLSKGAEAGSVVIAYAGGAAHVQFSTLGTGWTMTEAHLYLGGDPLPLVKRGKTTVATVAPGSYPYQSAPDDTAAAFDVTGLAGNIYAITHATVCRAQ
ncbi:MAG: hypothetical protein AB7P84_20265 [Alphaproteobacteria bacterium]